MTPADQAALTCLTEFLRSNPQIIKTAYPSDNPNEVSEFQTHAETASNWLMMGPRGPMPDDYFQGSNIGVYDHGVCPNRYCEPTAVVPAKAVAQMLYFYYNDEMSDLGFNVLEMKDGAFRVGRMADQLSDD